MYEDTETIIGANKRNLINERLKLARALNDIIDAGKEILKISPLVPDSALSISTINYAPKRTRLLEFLSQPLSKSTIRDGAGKAIAPADVKIADVMRELGFRTNTNPDD